MIDRDLGPLHSLGLSLIAGSEPTQSTFLLRFDLAVDSECRLPCSAEAGFDHERPTGLCLGWNHASLNATDPRCRLPAAADSCDEPEKAKDTSP